MWYLMENVQRSYTLSERLLRAIGIGHGGGTRREQEDIEDLIRQGADVNLAHGTFLPLHCACMVGDANSVSILIKWGADVSRLLLRVCLLLCVGMRTFKGAVPSSVRLPVLLWNCPLVPTSRSDHNEIENIVVPLHVLESAVSSC